MEFEIAGNTYSAGKMDTFKQFHVSRRLAPVLGGLATAAGDAEPAKNAEGGVDFARFLQPIAEAIASMPDADCDYILQNCLAVVKRQQGSAWAPIMVKGSTSMQFDDIDLAAMLQITAKVIEENLGGFFQGGAAALNKSEPTAAV